MTNEATAICGGFLICQHHRRIARLHFSVIVLAYLSYCCYT